MVCHGGTAATEAFTVASVPNVRLTDTRLHVSDPAGLLSATARDTINADLTALEGETGIEVAVVVVPSIGEDDAFGFAHTLFRQWGVGKKKSNNGLLILYVEDQRTIRFVTGYGIEGDMTDAVCKRIQTQRMVPRFKVGDRDGGMVAGVKAVCRVLSGTMTAGQDGGSDAVDGTVFLPLLFIAVVVLTLFMTGVINHRRRCPHCGKRALQLQSVDHYNLNGRKYRKEINVCRKCGHIDVRDIDETPNDGGAAGALLDGMVIGSMFGRGRGGFSGGGFSGGSFGGGSSGGGGAGSSW